MRLEGEQAFGQAPNMGSETDMPVAAVSDDEEKQLCINCLLPNSPLANFCDECGAPLSSYAATGPFESVFAQGYIYRMAVEKPRKATVMFGIWILFGPGIFSSVMPLLAWDKDGWPDAIFSGVTFLVCATVIWKTSWRYLSRPALSES